MKQDSLTGCRCDLDDVLFDQLWRQDDDTLFTARYLCIDIDDFMAWLDVNGLGPGDQVLIEIGRKLRHEYSDKQVFRTGGDEFVVELQDREPAVPDVGQGIILKHTVVTAVIRRRRARHHHIHSALRVAIARGMVEGRPGGHQLEYRYPEEPWR